MKAMELQAQRTRIIEALMQMDSNSLSRIENFIHYKLEERDGHYEMPASLLQALVDKTEIEMQQGKYTTSDQLRKEIQTW